MNSAWNTTGTQFGSFLKEMFIKTHYFGTSDRNTQSLRNGDSKQPIILVENKCHMINPIFKGMDRYARYFILQIPTASGLDGNQEGGTQSRPPSVTPGSHQQGTEGGGIYVFGCGTRCLNQYLLNKHTA